VDDDYDIFIVELTKREIRKIIMATNVRSREFADRVKDNKNPKSLASEYAQLAKKFTDFLK